MDLRGEDRQGDGWLQQHLLQHCEGFCHGVLQFSWRRNITKSLISKESTMSCTAASAMPIKCNFWRLFMNQSIKTWSSPWDSGFAEVWPPSSLDSNRKDNFLCSVSERDVNRSPTTRCSPWSPPSRRCWSTSPGRTSRGPTAGSGRGWRRPSLLRIIYSAKCLVYMKRNKYAKFHYAVILQGFSAIVFVNFKKRASIPLAPCI